MKENFIGLLEQLQPIGIIRVCSDFYLRPNAKGFVKSPATPDKTSSMKLYPATNTFCDFANGKTGGDIIRLVSYVKDIDNWTAAQELKAFYGLSDSLGQDKKDIRQKILKEQAAKRHREERKQLFRRALMGRIAVLKAQVDKYRSSIERGQIKPFTDEWRKALNRLQLLNYQLDILCCVPDKQYMRLKPDVTKGIPSDGPEWTLDVLAILAEVDGFVPAKQELQEIKKQYQFELCGRAPGKDRGYGVEW